MAKILLNHSVPTIECGCCLFGQSPIKRGWLTLAGITLFDNVALWFPKIQNDYWINFPAPAGSFDVIYESSSDPKKNARQIQNYIGKGEVRITFLKERGKDYRFVGIYKLDVDATRKSGNTDETRACVWERKHNQCDTDLKVLEDMLRKQGLI